MNLSWTRRWPIALAVLAALLLGVSGCAGGTRASSWTGLTIVEQNMTPYQAKNADELILAVSTQDVVGIVEFDGEQIGDGKVGQYTKKLMLEFEKYVANQSA